MNGGISSLFRFSFFFVILFLFVFSFCVKDLRFGFGFPFFVHIFFFVLSFSVAISFFASFYRVRGFVSPFVKLPQCYLSEWVVFQAQKAKRKSEKVRRVASALHASNRYSIYVHLTAICALSCTLIFA